MRSILPTAGGAPRRAVSTFAAPTMTLRTSLYTDDPDGNGVEFYADVVRDQREARKGIIIKQKPEYIPGVSSPALSERFYPQSPKIDF